MTLAERLRERRPLLLLIGGMSAFALLVLAVRLMGSFTADGVATAEVRKDRFVREVTALGTLKAVKATPIVAPPELRQSQTIAALAADGTVLRKGDMVIEFDPWAAAKEQADGRSDLATAAAKVDKTTAEGVRTGRTLGLDRDLAKDALDQARTFELKDEHLFSRNEIIESQLDKDLFTKKERVAGRKLETSGKLAQADRALGEIEAGKARVKIANAEKSLQALRIVAPHDGLLVLEKNWRGETTFVGNSVWPGEKVAQIPDLSSLEARVFVLEADAAGLKPGLKAVLGIEGQPGSGVNASVTRVDPLAKARDAQSPVKYFETILTLEKTDPALMKPGQRVHALIRLEEVDGVIAIPRGALFEKDGKRVVYRRAGSGFAAVPVTVGRNSVSRVVIESGLAPGDHIALRDPTAVTPADAKEASAPRKEARP